MHAIVITIVLMGGFALLTYIVCFTVVRVQRLDHRHETQLKYIEQAERQAMRLEAEADRQERNRRH